MNQSTEESDSALLIRLFNEYREELRINPILVHDFVGKDGDPVHRKRQRMLTISGFRSFARTKGHVIKKYFDNKKGKYDFMADVTEMILDAMLAENLEGAAAGIYNASIVQRLNNLVEKSETTVVPEQPLFARP
jgi:hypothetical protein